MTLPMSETERTEGSVLIVDDAPANLLALHAVLDPMGIRLVEASSGKQAVDLARREQFALVLLDVQMPDLDGFETARLIRSTESGRETPIIFLTAIYREEHYVRTGYAVGGADYLSKPFDPDVLRARVRSFVDLYNQREQLRHRQVQARTRERDEAIRQLMAFERIASAALESSNVEAFLATLLHVFVESVGSVDSAGILLREGDRLVARATLGLEEPVAAAFSAKVGDELSFAGRIAAKAEPTLIPDASESPLVPWARSSRLRGLLGVPLVSDGEVIGVAHIGSMRANDFSPSERRLFGAVAERAASAVDRVRSRKRVEKLLEAEQAARKGAEEGAARQRFLAEVSAVLASSLDNGATMAKLARMAVPSFASGCAIDEIGDGDTITRLAVTPGAGEAQASGQTGLEGLEAALAAIDVKQAIGAVDPVVTPSHGLLTMTIPLRRRQRTIGALSFVRTEARPFSPDDFGLGAEIGLRVAMALENAELYRGARAAVQIREDFVSIASHELKTPLTSLKLQLSSTRKRLPEDRNVILERLAIIDRQVDKITDLVGQLLDVSRIAGGRIDLEPQWVDLKLVIDRVVERFSTTAATSPGGSVFQVRGESTRAFVDPFRVEQIVTNLVANAVKYGKGKPIDVELSSASPSSSAPTSNGTTAKIVVRDQGIGIGPGEQARIFGRFERAVSSRQFGGFGLGLWIARQVVEASGGHISVKSDVGSGAEFVVTLPVNAQREQRAGLDHVPSGAHQ